MRALGIDLGTKRVGLAIGDTETTLALPLRTLDAPASLDELVISLVEVAREEQCDVFVVGHPLRLDGTPSESTRRSKMLAKRLKAEGSFKVVLWDERLSTSAAHRSLQSASSTRASARREHIDPVAASIFLQTFLESRQSRGERTWLGSEEGEAPAPHGKKSDSSSES